MKRTYSQIDLDERRKIERWRSMIDARSFGCRTSLRKRLRRSLDRLLAATQK
ncbi:hypothetical protein ABID19_005875 [Mesorhizobium robiniae]|uniref:Uncharacterized protein n=1 Tax=Mesorhizobium robiniae TaxID=559315 RepID=A0ABV2GX00_9HYPH